LVYRAREVATLSNLVMSLADDRGEATHCELAERSKEGHIATWLGFLFANVAPLDPVLQFNERLGPETPLRTPNSISLQLEIPNSD